MRPRSLRLRWPRLRRGGPRLRFARRGGRRFAPSGRSARVTRARPLPPNDVRRPFARPVGGTRYAGNRHMRVFGLLCCLLVVTACDERSIGPTIPLNTEFTLAPGQSTAIDGASMSIRFNGVSGDSRCPADAFCIQGGSADVRITAASDRSSGEYTLKTGDMRAVQHDDVTVALVQLAPYPFSSRTIASDEYRATLKATR
jgi:hypothetical protein